MRSRGIIAEIGSVHDGSFGNALKLIELCKSVGADFAKFQMHIPEFESKINAPAPAFFNEEDRFSYFKRTGFSIDQWRKIIEHCIKCNIEFMCSPFSIESAKILYDLGVENFKIASGEVTNIPMLEVINSFGKNIYLSTGMSNYAEIDEAILALNNSKLTLMQCSSTYPCPPNKVGLNVIEFFINKYPNINIGYSDHFDGIAAGYAAAAVGANIIEKHITFSKMMYGSDAPYALEPSKFSEYVSGIRMIWDMKDSNIDKNNISDYLDMKMIFEKSIVAKNKIKAGEIITFDKLAFKKPGSGLKPNLYKKLIGSVAKKDYEKDENIS